MPISHTLANGLLRPMRLLTKARIVEVGSIVLPMPSPISASDEQTLTWNTASPITSISKTYQISAGSDPNAIYLKSEITTVKNSGGDDVAQIFKIEDLIFNRLGDWNKGTTGKRGYKASSGSFDYNYIVSLISSIYYNELLNSVASGLCDSYDRSHTQSSNLNDRDLDGAYQFIEANPDLHPAKTASVPSIIKGVDSLNQTVYLLVRGSGMIGSEKWSRDSSQIYEAIIPLNYPGMEFAADSTIRTKVITSMVEQL